MTTLLKAALMFLAGAGAAIASEGCLPPSEPYGFNLDGLDEELRQLVNEEYQRFFAESEAYIRCLDAERAQHIVESQSVVARWVQLFGEDAAVDLSRK